MYHEEEIMENAQHEWVPIFGFPSYDVSQRGEIRNNQTGRIRRSFVNQQGIVSTTLYDEYNHRRTRSVAKIVAETYIYDGRRYFDTVIHLDLDRQNCAVYNLAWRPRWFAVHYHAQQPYSRAAPNLRIRNDNTGEEFDNCFHAAITYGMLEFEVYNKLEDGYYGHEGVFPHMHHYYPLSY